jgi:arginyl-tRNA synthetase
MIATGFEKYGSKKALDQDPIKHLFDVYVNISKDAEDPSFKDLEVNPVKATAAAWFKRMEDGDEDALRNWREWRELSVKQYEKEYERLNVKFDVYTGESMVGKTEQDKALAQLDKIGLIEDKGGAKVVNLEKWNLDKPVLRKKGEGFLFLNLHYLTSDFRWDFDLPHP